MKIYMVLDHDNEIISISDKPLLKMDKSDMWAYDVENGCKSTCVNKFFEEELFLYLRTFINGPEEPVELELP